MNKFWIAIKESDNQYALRVGREKSEIVNLGTLIFRLGVYFLKSDILITLGNLDKQERDIISHFEQTYTNFILPEAQEYIRQHPTLFQ